MGIEGMTILEIKNSPGVSDLPTRVAGFFAMALKAEDSGEHEKAQSRLEQAVKSEQDIRNG
jgi:hypothetical protein